MLEKTEHPRELILKRIEQQGFINVAEYMQIAVSAYYSNKMPFGKEGDFITAPEVSQLFGEMIGFWLVDMWAQLGEPDKVNLVELGPGRGTLLADAMRVISKLSPQLNAAININLVETSLPLRELQKEALKNYKVNWYNSFEDTPEGFSFIIANEFFDALPIQQFEKTLEGWKEKIIIYNSETDSFSFSLGSDVKEIPEQFLNAEEGSIFEINPLSLTIAKDISKKIYDNGGAGLIIDYGYKETALGDSLQGMKKHKYVDVLSDIGEADITAHVNFENLKISLDSFAKSSDILSQAEFLKVLGVEIRAAKLCEGKDLETKDEIMKGLERLISDKEMGELFKVLFLAQKKL